jgi:transposase-like protein
MRKSWFTEEQIIGVLKEHQAGLPVAELCRKHGMSDATFYNWRSKYGGVGVSDLMPSGSSRRAIRPPTAAADQASKLSAQHILQHRLVQREVGHNLLSAEMPAAAKRGRGGIAAAPDGTLRAGLADRRVAARNGGPGPVGPI